MSAECVRFFEVHIHTMKRRLLQISLLSSIYPTCRQMLVKAPTFPSLQIPSNRPINTSSYKLAEDTSFSDYSVPKLSRRESPSLSYKPPPKPHRLCIYATKHNCHITLTRGNRDPLISISSGNIGFKKAQRGTYDAAYQLGTFVMGKINNQGLLSPEYPGKGGPIKELEVVLRDFGPGREAVTKILLGAEGRALRSKISRVMDSTRLKFGGTRSPKPRRLG